jgi:hypothetical protein
MLIHSKFENEQSMVLSLDAKLKNDISPINMANFLEMKEDKVTSRINKALICHLRAKTTKKYNLIKNNGLVSFRFCGVEYPIFRACLDFDTDNDSINLKNEIQRPASFINIYVEGQIFIQKSNYPNPSRAYPSSAQVWP